MMAKSLPAHNRQASYGQQRSFRGLERYAIARRLRAAQAPLAALVAEQPGRKLAVLELGCGYYGRNLQLLAEQFPHLQFTGVDLAVEKSSHKNIKLQRGDITTWKPKQTYDMVLSLAVAEHLSDPAAHFILIARSLRKGGRAVITTPTPQAHSVLSTLAALGIFDRAEIADHQLYLTEQGLRKMAVDAKLSVESYQSFSFGLNQSMQLRKS
jgi:trans-aconitate methyltransferase